MREVAPFYWVPSSCFSSFSFYALDGGSGDSIFGEFLYSGYIVGWRLFVSDKQFICVCIRVQCLNYQVSIFI